MTSENTLSAAQMEFFAEDEMITIIPNFKMDGLHFIRGTYGPFEPARPCVVPLWLGLTLKKRRKCRIQPPKWLDPVLLAKHAQEEKQKEVAVGAMPFHYMEIAALLIAEAPDDIRNVSETQSLIEDIASARAAKIRAGLHKIHQHSTVFLENLSAMEINRVRSIMISAMNQFYVLAQDEANATQDSSSQNTQ